MMIQNKIPSSLMWMLPYVPEQSAPLMIALTKSLPGSQDQEVLTIDHDENLDVKKEQIAQKVVDIPEEDVILDLIKGANICTKLVSKDYCCITGDAYIGVNSDGPTQITLPLSPKDGTVIIVKAEMSSALLNRRVSIITADGSLIDGRPKHMIVKSYGVVSLLYREGNWNVI